MSLTLEKLEDFTKTTEATLEKLGKTNPDAAKKAEKMKNFQEGALAPAMAHTDQYINAATVGMSGPGGSRATPRESESNDDEGGNLSSRINK